MRKLSFFLAFALVLTFTSRALAATTEVGVVSFDNITNEYSPGVLRAGKTHVVSINYDVRACLVSGFWMGSNGFKVYSETGADWGYLQGSLGPVIADLSLAVTKYEKHFETADWSSTFSGDWTQTGGVPPGIDPAGGSAGASSGVGFFAAITSSTDGWYGGSAGTNGIAVYLEFESDILDDGGNLCIDENHAITAWEWANASDLDHPQWDNGLGARESRCWEIYDVPNKMPVWCGFEDPEDPPPSGNADPFNHCGQGSYQLCASDPDDPDTGPLTYRLVPPYDEGNHGSVTEAGLWTWLGGTVPQDANVSIQFQVNDTKDDAESVFTLNVSTTNNAPTILCPGGILTVSAETTKSQTVTAGDVDVCDNISVTVVANSGTDNFDINNTSVVDNGDGTFDIVFTPATPVRLVEMDVQVDDGDEQVTCMLSWNVIEGAPYAVELEKLPGMVDEEMLPGVFQGHFVDLGIILHKTDFTQGIGGFDFLVAYDASALVFQLASEGDIYAACGWEYFTYRFGAYGNCGNACPSGMLRVIGLAETNDGPNHPGCIAPDVGYVQQDQLPITLASLRFLVSDDRTLECQYVPVRFFWYDCGDNVISNHDGSEMYLSQGVFDFFAYNDPFVGSKINGVDDFPTFLGAQAECILDEGEKVAKRNVDYQNGGVDIVCADLIDARGDINLNGLTYEIADAVMFTNYFISGLSAFGSHVEGSIAASDANADGITLSVADLVYLVRVVVGDASPYPKIAPVAATITVGNGRIGVDADMGAAFIKIEGDVTPRLLADNMEMKYNAVDGNTHILVYSTEAGESFRGDFLEVSGSIVSTEFATYEGAPVAAKVMPSTFVVEQNYPNPFNPSTKIRFQIPGAGAWELGIYNITGQLVQSFSGNSETGFEEVVWDASDLSSGIYFYRVSTDEHSMTKKAVLLK